MHQVGSFYFERNSFSASASRFEEILEKYKGFAYLDETLFKLALSLENLGRVEEATVYYSQVAQEYPFSQHFEEAKEKLVLLERPVPSVDQTKAAHNESRRLEEEEEGFSILDPVRSVVGIFTGREDPYEVARRRAEERQMENSGGIDSSP